MPVVVSGTYQVLSKCFLGEYLMNVSKKKKSTTIMQGVSRAHPFAMISSSFTF